MKLKKRWISAAVAVSVTGGTLAYMAFAPAKQVQAVLGSDHREAPTVDAMAEGDITDVYLFTDPNDSTRVVFIMNVNPFSVPGESPSYSFSPDLLYQFKIDNTGDAVEDLVIQVVFNQSGQAQTASVFGPVAPTITGARNVLTTSAATSSKAFSAATTKTSRKINSSLTPTVRGAPNCLRSHSFFQMHA